MAIKFERRYDLEVLRKTHRQTNKVWTAFLGQLIECRIIQYGREQFRYEILVPGPAQRKRSIGKVLRSFEICEAELRLRLIEIINEVLKELE